MLAAAAIILAVFGFRSTIVHSAEQVTLPPDDIEQAWQRAEDAAKRAEVAAWNAEDAARVARQAADHAKALLVSSGRTPSHGPSTASDHSPPQVASAQAPTPRTQASGTPRVLQTGSNPGSVGFQSAFQLSANQTGGNATVKLSQPDSAQQQGILYGLTLSSPIAKNSDAPTHVATLDGLVNAGSAAFTLAKYSLLDDNKPDASPSIVYGATAKIGYQQFTYFDHSTLAKNQTSKTPTSGSVFAGTTLGPDQRMLLLAKFEYQNAYKDATSNVLCPAPSSAPTKCINGPIGAPPRTTGHIYSLEGRYTASRFDLDPVLSYDSVSHVKGVNFPIYFIGGVSDDGKPSAFNAGIDLGWRSDTHVAMLGIFVGSPFSFWDVQ